PPSGDVASGQVPPAEPIPPPPPPPPPTNTAMKDHLRDIADALADSPLAESPAFRRMVASFDRVKAPPQAPRFAGWDRRLEQWQERFAAVGARMPKLSWPKNDPSPRGAGGRAPAAPAFPDEAPGGGTQVIFLVLGAATAGLLAWGLLRRRGL